MEQTRSWFNRFQPRGDRLKGALGKKNGSTGSDSGKELSKGPRAGAADELPSSITRQKVAAAKQYIESHYKSQMKNLQERKERYARSYHPMVFRKFSSFTYSWTSNGEETKGGNRKLHML